MIKRLDRFFRRMPARFWIAFSIAGVFILLIAAGFTYTTVQEQQDSFCVACHTQPEVLFYQRSIASAPVDLASDHTTKEVRCIECHDGAGVFGHIEAGALGLRNTLLFYSGLAVQPARQTVPIRDGACLKCHEAVVLLLERNNHEHTLLAEWQAKDPHAGGCTSCHTGHTTDGPALDAFISMSRSQPTCDACHKVLRDVPGGE